jgi:hypothetical protein
MIQSLKHIERQVHSSEENFGIDQGFINQLRSN